MLDFGQLWCFYWEYSIPLQSNKVITSSKMEANKDINRIKVVLVEKKRTNKWLAEQLGKDPATVSKWCTNTAQPGLETLLEIARVLEVDVKELLNSTRDDVKYIKNTILLGAGWREYEKSVNLYTKYFWKTVLDKRYLHSVRDNYTKARLRKMGIGNVINTGCPTMWNLTPEFCSTVPEKKAKNVINSFALKDLPLPGTPNKKED